NVHTGTGGAGGSLNITCSGDIDALATAGTTEGVIVNFPPPNVSISSECTLVSVTCSRSPGSVFPIGTTTVACSTMDPASGQLVACQFTVTVKDSHPPVVVCPQDMTVECLSPDGTPVPFVATATDLCDPSPDIQCEPPSGSLFPVGVTTVICRATDDAGNSSECSFTVTVRDTTPPEITCPQGPVRADCTVFQPAPGTIVSYPDPVNSDACGGVTFQCEPPPGSFFPLGTTIVKCTATDAAGNSSECTFEVQVVDTTPPQLVCPGDFGVECTSPDGAAVTYPPPVVADACDGDPTAVCEPPSGSLFPMGPTTGRCVATDDSGNSVECSFVVTVQDTTPPLVACPGDKVTECTSSGGAVVTYETTAADTCDPDPSVVCDPPSGSTFPLGSTLVRCRAVDQFGNESTCSFSVTVIDTTPPAITCPDPIVAECQGPDGARVAFTVNASDACGDASTSCTPASGDLFPIGTTTVACVATDPSGNSSRCEFTVTVVDTTPPRITCSQDAIVLECTSDLTAPAVYPLPIASDDCDARPTVSCDPPLGTLLGLGVHTVTCAAVDAAGNRAECSFEVRVVDTAPPALNCPQDIVRECEGPDGARVEYALPTPTDTCDPAPNLVCLPASGSLFPMGETTVTCTADDQAGNMVMCTFKVTVVDTTPPLIECPADIRAKCTSADGAVVTFAPSVSDLCDPAPTVRCEPPSGSTFPLGTTTVKCTATDRSGNSASCEHRVTVFDDTPPTIVCPNGFETACTENGTAVVEYPAPQVTDDCDPAPRMTCEPPSGTVLPKGDHVIRCTAVDHAGNTASCELIVKVVDVTPPSLVCPPDVTAECESPGGAVVTYPIPTATDACDAKPAVDCVPPPGSLFPMGQTEVVCTARDMSGNEMTCTFLVTVRDTTPPQITCPGDLRPECTGPDGAVVEFTVTAADRCDPEVTVTCEPPSGTLFPIGSTTVRCRTQDDSGNAAECSFTVTVVDTTPPSITCPADMIVEGTTSGQPPHKPAGWPPGSNPPPNMITATVVYAVPTADDRCQTEDVQVTCDPPPGTRLGFGEHTVTCRARDRAGNEAACTFKVTVILGDRAFIRSDANQDSLLDIADPVFTIMALFGGGRMPMCEKSADANDDGRLDLSDAVYSINYQFRGGPRPPPPAPPLCGLDATLDPLDCVRYVPCE
ncbi:MAG: HYR domain-containing protein, partial [Planctomycetes bacterium]|nr:HYR domain-containing protein [Planctomycetota bacterium]